MEKIIFISMKCLFWNVKGLGNPAKRRMIADVIRTNKIDIICMVETKLTDFDPRILRSIALRKFYDFYILNARGA